MHAETDTPARTERRGAAGRGPDELEAPMTPFMRGLMRQPPMVKAWVGLLVLVNGVAALFFLPPLEANVVLVTLGLSGVMMELLT